jgi:TIR domain
MTAKVPTVFISYAWEDDVRVWVRSLATRLRREGGVDVQIDQWNIAPGDSLTAFMESAVRTNDFVLLVCTPRYKTKSDSRQGGVGYEGEVITGEVFTRANHRKFIPILRKGDWSSAAPSFLLGKLYLDFRSDPYSEASYEDLLKTLHGQLERPPTLGPTPTFGGASQDSSATSSAPAAEGTALQLSAVAVERAGQQEPKRVRGTLNVKTIVVMLAAFGVLIFLAMLFDLPRSLLLPATTDAGLLGQPERGWLEAYGAAIDSRDVDHIIALHVLPTPRFFKVRNQSDAQLRELYGGWFNGDGRTRRTGFDKCSLANVATDGSRSLRCETFVDPPFAGSPSRVPTCLIFRGDGKLLSRTEITKGSDCPPP